MAEENYNEEENEGDSPIETNEPLVDKSDRKLRSRVCPCCKQEYNTKVGIDNWKKLFRKPTMEDWITLIILVLLMVAAYAYSVETKVCKETLQNLDEICSKRISQVNYTWNGVPDMPSINYTAEIENEIQDLNSSNVS